MSARRRARGLRAALVQVGELQLLITSEISASLNAVLAEIRGYSGAGSGGDRRS